MPRRRRPLLAVLLLAAAFPATVSLRLAAAPPPFDGRFVTYHRSRIVRQRPALVRPGRREFMAPYEPRTLVRIAGRGLLDGYRGQDLAADPVLTRFEVAALLGRFLRLVNARDGTVFEGRRSLDHHLLWVPRRGYGLFDVEAALAERYLLPDRRPTYWEVPVSRYALAAIAGRLLTHLETRYELIRQFERHPAHRMDDFVMYGHHYWFLTRIALEFGVMEPEQRRFRGRDPVRGHAMACLLERLVTVVDGYQRDGDPRPWRRDLVDSSSRALEVPDPFPDAQATISRAFVEPVSRPARSLAPEVLPRQRTFDPWAPEVLHKGR